MSKHLFQECIERYLAGKTRILATHQLQYIKTVDGIILLEQGQIKYFSHYQSLLEYRPEYKVLLVEENEKSDDSDTEKAINIRRQFSSSSNRVSEFSFQLSVNTGVLHGRFNIRQQESMMQSTTGFTRI